MSATATAPAKKFTLTQALVTRYAKLSALKNLIDKWLDEKRALFQEALLGQSCPDKGPYLLERNEVALGPNYKAILVERLESDGMKQEDIAAYIKARSTGTCIRLEKKINPNYRKTFTLKLPA